MSKITDEQLSTIKEQQEKLLQVQSELGYLECYKHTILHKVAGMNKEIEDYKVVLEGQYGSVNINLEDGTYTPIDNAVPATDETVAEVNHA
tara:strand:- start:851 stop:1123 length:273 start_codon:yes stop_codon:yes gene_type:complete